jgi:hypothetical protein
MNDMHDYGNDIGYSLNTLRLKGPQFPIPDLILHPLFKLVPGFSRIPVDHFVILHCAAAVLRQHSLTGPEKDEAWQNKNKYAEADHQYSGFWWLDSDFWQSFNEWDRKFILNSLKKHWSNPKQMSN